jgi:hypothetical protein
MIAGYVPVAIVLVGLIIATNTVDVGGLRVGEVRPGKSACRSSKGLTPLVFLFQTFFREIRRGAL